LATGLKTQHDIMRMLNDRIINIDVTFDAGASRDLASVCDMTQAIDMCAADASGAAVATEAHDATVHSDHGHGHR